MLTSLVNSLWVWFQAHPIQGMVMIAGLIGGIVLLQAKKKALSDFGLVGALIVEGASLLLAAVSVMIFLFITLPLLLRFGGFVTRIAAVEIGRAMSEIEALDPNKYLEEGFKATPWPTEEQNGGGIVPTQQSNVTNTKEDCWVNSSDTATFRTGPDQNAPLIGQIPSDAQLRITAWTPSNTVGGKSRRGRTNWDGHDGWVHEASLVSCVTVP